MRPPLPVAQVEELRYVTLLFQPARQRIDAPEEQDVLIGVVVDVSAAPDAAHAASRWFSSTTYSSAPDNPRESRYWPVAGRHSWKVTIPLRGPFTCFRRIRIR